VYLWCLGTSNSDEMLTCLQYMARVGETVRHWGCHWGLVIEHSDRLKDCVGLTSRCS
jgi:hypothetical protein